MPKTKTKKAPSKPKKTVTLKKGDFTTTNSEIKERLLHAKPKPFSVKVKTIVMTEDGKRSQWTFVESAKEIEKFLKKK